MLEPSYAELMDVLNNQIGKSDEVTSRYTIVIAAAKRARQLIEGDEPMVPEKKGKPVSTAVAEIFNSKIKIVPEGEGTVLVFNKEDDEEFEKSEFDSTNIERKIDVFKNENDKAKAIEELDDEFFDDELDDE